MVLILSHVFVFAAEEGLSKTEHALKPAETAPTSK